MTEPADGRPTAMPILTALAVVAVALIVIFALRMIRGDEQPAEGQVARAAVGQNDALQREDYADFRLFTCATEQGIESQVLADQRQSKVVKGARFVDDVAGVSVTGDRATATVEYHFEKLPDNRVKVPMTFVRENGDWKVCSSGAR